MTSLRAKITAGYNSIKPFKDIIWFLILFFFFDFLWKLCTSEGEDHNSLFIFGKDYTKTIEPICLLVAEHIHWAINSLLGFSNYKIDGVMVYFEGSLRFRIVWGCTGVKQILMFAFIMVFYFGPWKKKLWFIPLSLILLYILNIARIIGIVFITRGGFPEWFIQFNEWRNGYIYDYSNESYWKFYVDWFQLFHRDIFGWLYYLGGVFLLWLLWQEKFNLPFQNKRKKEAEETAKIDEQQNV